MLRKAAQRKVTPASEDHPADRRSVGLLYCPQHEGQSRRIGPYSRRKATDAATSPYAGNQAESYPRHVVLVTVQPLTQRAFLPHRPPRHHGHDDDPEEESGPGPEEERGPQHKEHDT